MGQSSLELPRKYSKMRLTSLTILLFLVSSSSGLIEHFLSALKGRSLGRKLEGVKGTIVTGLHAKADLIDVLFDLKTTTTTTLTKTITTTPIPTTNEPEATTMEEAATTTEFSQPKPTASKIQFKGEIVKELIGGKRQAVQSLLDLLWIFELMYLDTET